MKDKKKENEEEEYEDIESILSILEPPIIFDSAAELALMFENNRTLIHIDFSYNDFKEADCKKLAGGLKWNHNILGAHFVGN